MSNDNEVLYSQFDEELIIREFFQDRRDGFYVDVGAAWGQKESTTLYLDRELNWRGIGIDALDFYGKSWGVARPHSKFFSYAVSDTSGEQVIFYQCFIPTLSSLHPEMLEKWDYPREKANQLQVETIRLDDLLEREGVKSIDFLSIDAEGSEPAVLRGFSIDRYRPELVCIEAWPEDNIRNEVLDYFSDHGYRRMTEYDERDKVNWYFCLE